MNNNIKFSYPDSEKVYIKGKIFPQLKVAMRKINLTDKQKWIDCILENMNTQWALDTKKLSNYSFENFKKSMQLVFDGESK